MQLQVGVDLPDSLNASVSWTWLQETVIKRKRLLMRVVCLTCGFTTQATVPS